jgi:hypothetical protein
MLPLKLFIETLKFPTVFGRHKMFVNISSKKEKKKGNTPLYG